MTQYVIGYILAEYQNNLDELEKLCYTASNKGERIEHKNFLHIRKAGKIYDNLYGLWWRCHWKEILSALRNSCTVYSDSFCQYIFYNNMSTLWRRGQRTCCILYALRFSITCGSTRYISYAGTPYDTSLSSLPPRGSNRHCVLYPLWTEYECACLL